MSWNVVRSTVAALLLALVVLAATPAHAAPSVAPALEAGTVLQQIWGWVTSIFGGGEGVETDHRCTIDPNGCPDSGVAIESDHRCTIDPNGGMICGE
jgi:hypothetical protein